MFHRRSLLLAGIALLILGLIVVPSMQRDAWLQGYLTGQMAAQDGAKGITQAAPYLYGGYGRPAFGPHFGGFGLLLLIGVGLFVFTGIGRGLRQHAWQHFYGDEGPHNARSQPGEGPGMPWGRPGGPWSGYRRGGPRPPWWGGDEPGAGGEQPPADSGESGQA